MGAAYSQDLRDRVVRAYDRGMASKQIADLFAVSRAWVRRVKQRRRESGQIAPKPMGGPGTTQDSRRPDARCNDQGTSSTAAKPLWNKVL